MPRSGEASWHRSTLNLDMRGVAHVTVAGVACCRRRGSGGIPMLLGAMLGRGGKRCDVGVQHDEKSPPRWEMGEGE
ncbi:hypothetical protein BDU57DRAFT_332846 [Ampelomyces quisqualis]|uniref:Uncharacterized protein n=1 Tax=Ampelomyces quisqualis TaxID=50730 RepID=A0A6A5QEV4_AMPQU|nr:hypothetical protein BDU57DRAFT_332846 [Ampelomyces quisqualis]